VNDDAVILDPHPLAAIGFNCLEKQQGGHRDSGGNCSAGIESSRIPILTEIGARPKNL
jgi:hypothetical protein